MKTCVYLNDMAFNSTMYFDKLHFSFSVLAYCKLGCTLFQKNTGLTGCEQSFIKTTVVNLHCYRQ